MQPTKQAFKDSLVSGTIAGIATAGALAWKARQLKKSPFAPINAVSHVLYGDKAARVRKPTLKNTLSGFLINHASTIFWAFIFEKLFGRLSRKAMLPKAFAGAGLVSGLAYVTDYKLMPKRLQPGVELAGPRKSMLKTLYTSLALALPLREILMTRRQYR